MSFKCIVTMTQTYIKKLEIDPQSDFEADIGFIKTWKWRVVEQSQGMYKMNLKFTLDHKIIC